MTEQDWLIIVNPHAGSGKTLAAWIRAEQELRRLALPCRIVTTEYKSHTEVLAREGAEQGFRRLLAVGGDGSVHEVFNGVLGWCAEHGADPADFVIGVAPIGSGNDWLRSLGVPRDIRQVFRRMKEGSFGRQDVFRLTDGAGRVRYMANIGGTGLDAHVCALVNQAKSRGKRSRLIYLMALLRAIRSLHAIRVQVSADGKEVFSGPCYSIALGCGAYSGGGMRQVPLARPDDGLLDVLIVPQIPLHRILVQLPLLFSGRLHRSPDLHYVQCRDLEILPMDEDARDIIETDGEVEGRLPLSVHVTGQKTGVIC